jgi:hypothetical protein
MKVISIIPQIEIIKSKSELDNRVKIYNKNNIKIKALTIFNEIKKSLLE